MGLAGQQDGWRAHSACASADPDLFYPLSLVGRSASQIRRAKAICARCPVRNPCLSFALANSDAHGIWGGTTGDERVALRGTPRRPAEPEPAG